MGKIDELESKLQKVVDVRESGDLTASRRLFEELVKEIKSELNNTSLKEIKDLYVSIMGQYVIQLRLEGGAKYYEALKIGREIYEFDKKNDLKNILAPRSVSHPLGNLGNFEQAEAYMRELIEITRNNPFKQGEEMAHLAICLLRIGRPVEAENMIGKAVRQLTSSDVDDRYRSIPYSRALMYKALILNAKGEISEAYELAKEALELSKKDKLPFRIAQAEELLRFLSSKIKAQ